MSIRAKVYKHRREAEKAAQAMVDGGVPREQIGILMSEKTQGREFTWVHNSSEEILAPIATGAVMLPGIGMVAAGPLIDDLAGQPASMNMTEVLVAELGVGGKQASALVRGIQAGGIMVVAEVDTSTPMTAGTSTPAPPAKAAAPAPAPPAPAPPEPIEVDSQTRRFELLELD